MNVEMTLLLGIDTTFLLSVEPVTSQPIAINSVRPAGTISKDPI